CIRRVLRAIIKLFDGQLNDLTLNLLALLVASVPMRRQSLRFHRVARAKELDDGARRVHSARCVNPWPNAKANIVSCHAGAITTTAYFHQSAQAGVPGFCKIMETKRNDSPILSG